MRIVTKEELVCYKPTNNCVLIKPVFKPDEIPVGDKVLYMDEKWSKGNENWVINEVVSVPKKLTFGEQNVFTKVNLEKDPFFKEYRNETITARHMVGMPWSAKMELSVGDVVWVNRFTMTSVHNNQQYLQCQGDRYYLFPYQDIYLKKTKTGIKMLNGWCLVEPIDEGSDKMVELGLPKIEGLKSDHYGYVRFMSDPIDWYYDARDAGEDPVEVSIGDIIVFKWQQNRRVGNDITKLNGQQYICSRRRNFAAILQPSMF